MIQRSHRRLLVTAIVAIVITLAVASAWLYSLGPAERASTLARIRLISVKGVLTGGTFALLALGFTWSYGVAEVVNMAHGALFMVGTYIFFFLVAPQPFGFLQLNAGPAAILAVICTGIIGAFVYVLTIHPIIEDHVAVLVVTVGVALIFQQLMLLQFTSKHMAVPPFLTGHVSIWGVTVTYSRILAFAASLVLFAGVWVFIIKTKIGGAMRAVAQDREMAMLVGINTTRLYMLTMGIAASLAAVAGIFIVSSTSQVAQPYMWLHPLAVSFAIVILGGLGSIKGTFVGAFIVGFAETAVEVSLPEGGFLKGAFALGIMVVILLLRPRGLFGKRIELEE